MNQIESILYKARDFKSIELWKDVTHDQWNDPVWQLTNSITTVKQLKYVIRLNKHQEQEIQRTINVLSAEGKEPFRITPYYASLMHADPFHPVMLAGEKSPKRLDPIFWQTVPTPANLLFPNTGIEAMMSEGTRSFGAAYQRYPNRVALFVAENTSCAAYCVHCQRSKSLDSTVDVSLSEINKGLFYIDYNENIDEVLVTGGDALRISKKRLKYILEELSKIPHLRAIRIATRVPVVLPMGVTEELLSIIKESANKHSVGLEKHVYFMTHINHYHEITDDMAAAIKRIHDHGFTIRNQTVFLNHVNDYYKTLAETFRRMLWIGVHPYYLLQCHKEKGMVHFVVPIQIGKIYMKHLQGWISGITRPDYAANVEGGGGKVMLMPSGHDTLNLSANIEEKISESYANIATWDSRELLNYEALGRASRAEYEQAVEIMNKFIGRKGVFMPKVIIVDEKGNHIETTNRTKLPFIANSKKSKLLGYKRNGRKMPITNPIEIFEELERQYMESKFIKRSSRPSGNIAGIKNV